MIPVIATSFKEKKNFIEKNKADFFISDNVAILSISGIHRIVDLNINKNLSYGIVYPKGSKLKNMLDPVIKYYLKSSRFYKRLKDHSNKEIADYFTKHVKNAYR